MDRFSAVNDPARIAQLLSQYAEATEFWELSTKEHAALLDLPIATFSRIKNGSYRGRLSQDKVMRITYVVAIRKALDVSGHPPLWLLAYNALPEYNGVSPLDKILDGGIIAMNEILTALFKRGFIRSGFPDSSGVV